MVNFQKTAPALIRGTLSIVCVSAIVFLLVDFKEPSNNQEPLFSQKMTASKQNHSKSILQSGYNEPYLAHKKTKVVASGSYIYWQPSQQNFFVGETINSDIITSKNVVRRTKDFKFKYQSGFKVGLGAIFPEDNWTLYGEYVRLHSNIHSHVQVNGPSFAQSSWTPLLQPDNPTFSEITNYWNFQFDLFDLNLLRAFYVGKSLVFSPFITGRGVLIHQRLKATSFYTATQGPVSTESNFKQHSLQIGPRIGTDLYWLLGKGFKFSGKIGGALLYNRNHTKSKSPYLVHSDTPYVVNDTFSSTQGSFCPNLDMGVGFGWENKKNIGFSLNYDILTFFNQNNLGNNHVLNQIGNSLDVYETPYGFQSQNNLTMHGLTVTAQIAF